MRALPSLGFVGVGLAMLFVAARPLRAAEEKQPPRPNIVVILADDMGYSDLGCYGGEIRTPHVDALAREGVRFTQFYNCGRCCPTRAALLTGLYPHQAGVGHMTRDYHLPGYRGDLNRRCMTLAEVLRTAGYRTYMAGKWHVTGHVGYWTGNRQRSSKHNWPTYRGFDRFFGTIFGGGSYFNPVGLVRDDEPIPGDTPPGFYYTDAIADHAVQFIREHASGNKASRRPFFCYVAFTSPHWPLHALEEDIARYRGRYDQGWDHLRLARYRRMVQLGLIAPRWKLSPRDPTAPAWEQVPPEQRRWYARRMEVYAAQIDRMDQGIGRIMQALRETGQWENTLVLVLADNGGCAEEIRPSWKGIIFPKQTRDGRPVRLGNDPAVMPGGEDTYQSYGLPWANASNTPFRRYKHWVHEGGISTPLVAHWPRGIPAEMHGRLVHQPAHVIDIMATCIDLSGAKYPREYRGHPVQPPEGVSLAPAFRGRSLRRPEPLFWEHEGNRAVRQGRWKLVAVHQGPWELYDMTADRSELHNLAQQHPQRVQQMARAWQQWADRAGVVPWRSWVKKKKPKARGQK